MNDDELSKSLADIVSRVAQRSRDEQRGRVAHPPTPAADPGRPAGGFDLASLADSLAAIAATSASADAEDAPAAPAKVDEPTPTASASVPESRPPAVAPMRVERGADVPRAADRAGTPAVVASVPIAANEAQDTKPAVWTDTVAQLPVDTPNDVADELMQGEAPEAGVDVQLPLVDLEWPALPTPVLHALPRAAHPPAPMRAEAPPEANTASIAGRERHGNRRAALSVASVAAVAVLAWGVVRFAGHDGDDGLPSEPTSAGIAGAAADATSARAGAKGAAPSRVATADTAATPVLSVAPVAQPEADARPQAAPSAPAAPAAIDSKPTLFAMNQPSPPNAPGFGFVAEGADDGSNWVARQLSGDAQLAARLVGPSVPSDGWEATLAALKVQPRVAVARYDALQAAHSGPAAARMPQLEIVAPLSADLIYFVVRADSPLKYIQDIQGRSIDVGPPQGARALTARSVYSGMFGTALPAGRRIALDDGAALQQLAAEPHAGANLDVVVVVGTSPESALVKLSPELAQRLRLLTLKRDDPRARKVAASFLPTPVPVASLGNMATDHVTTLAVMSFLVTARAGDGKAADHDRTIAALAGSLCAALPRLADRSNTFWNGVSPALQLDVGWPYSAAAQEALARCEPARATAASKAPSVPTDSTSVIANDS